MAEQQISAAEKSFRFEDYEVFLVDRSENFSEKMQAAADAALDGL